MKQKDKARHSRSVQPLMAWAGRCQNAGRAEPSLGVLSEARYQLGVGRYGYVSLWLGIWMSRRGLRVISTNPLIWRAFWRDGRVRYDVN